MDVIKSMHAIHSAAIDDQECLYESRKENWMHSPDKSSKFHSMNANLSSLYDKHSEEQLSQCQAIDIISESFLTIHTKDEASQCQEMNTVLPSLLTIHTKDEASQCQERNTELPSLLAIHTKDEASQCQEMNTELPSLLAVHTKDEASQFQAMNTILPSSLTTHNESVGLQNRKMDKIIPSLQGATSTDECPAISMQNVPLFVKLAVNKYRKLVSWWTFVKETPRVLDSDLNCLFNYAKAANNIPLHNFSAEFFKMTSTFLTFQRQVVNIKEGLDHLSCEIHILMNFAVNSHLGLFREFSTQYNEIIETAYEILEEFIICRELLQNFIISRQIILGHNALNDANIQFNMQNEYLYNKW